MAKKVFVVSDNSQRNFVIRYLQNADITRPLSISIGPYVKNRTLAQNRLMHKWFSLINKHWFMATGNAFGEQTWKDYLKDKFLGYESRRMPDGHIKRFLRETSKCNTKELTEFLEMIESWAVDELELVLPSGDDLYFEAMGYTKARVNSNG